MPLAIALVTPVPLDAPRGNAVTVARIARGLASRGVDVRVRGTDDLDGLERADVVHAFHAVHAGPAARDAARALDVPLVVTLTGTDVSAHLADARTSGAVRDVLRAAAAVTAFHASVGEALRAVLPDVADRLAIVPQSVCFPAPDRMAPRAPAIDGSPCVLFPAGIRPVKRPLMPLSALDAFARAHPSMRLWLAGPALDAGEAARLEAALAPRPWARWIGAVPHASMPPLIGAADIVLNCSISEGGMANAVLEAMALGRAVLASDIPGNRSIVEDGVTGLLFSSGATLAAQMARLADDRPLRQRLARAGQALVGDRLAPAVETDGYLDVYRRALGGRGPSR